MSMELGWFTASPSGSNTLLLNGSFTPSYIVFEMGPRPGTAETKVMRSHGEVDIANGLNYSISNFGVTSDFSSKDSTANCIAHYNPSGTKVVEATFTSSASGQFTINLGTANASYRIYFRAYG